MFVIFCSRGYAKNFVDYIKKTTNMSFIFKIEDQYSLIDSNGIRTHKHLICKGALNHLG